MRLVVLKPGVWRDSKFNYGRNRRVTFKDIDNPKTYYYLNLTEEHGVVNKWEPAIVAGNIIDAQITPGTNRINKFGQFQVIKNIQGKE